MQRTPEPELMLDEAQAIAYAEADFSESDARFVDRFRELFGTPAHGDVLDLGCGPGNIALRMAEVLPDCRITGVDGSTAMLEIARKRAGDMSLDTQRVRFMDATLPSPDLPGAAVAVVSNSLLHHLHRPAVLWDTLRQATAPGAAVLVGDLRRPASTTAAQAIVDEYAGDAPAVLQEDFYNSLLAAFEVDEVRAQLEQAGLAMLQVDAIGDRHLEVRGHMPG